MQSFTTTVDKLFILMALIEIGEIKEENLPVEIIRVKSTSCVEYPSGNIFFSLFFEN